jgi:hypothetical protein
MQASMKEAGAIAERVRRDFGDRWTPYDLGRHAYHMGIQDMDNPCNDAPIEEDAYDRWLLGWLAERDRDADEAEP